MIWPIIFQSQSIILKKLLLRYYKINNEFISVWFGLIPFKSLKNFIFSHIIGT